MKTILLLSIFFASSLLADTYVRGHYRKNGSYVKGHYRSSSDSSHNNNWSTKGNVNPYTGSYGTKRRRVESYQYKSNTRKRSRSRSRSRSNIYGF